MCPAWWDSREAISLGSIPYFRQTGALPVAGHGAPKRWTQMDLGIKEGSVGGSWAVLPCFEHTHQVGGRPPLVQGRREGTFNSVPSLTPAAPSNERKTKRKMSREASSKRWRSNIPRCKCPGRGCSGRTTPCHPLAGCHDEIWTLYQKPKGHSIKPLRKG